MKSHYLDGRGNFRCRFHGAFSSGPKTPEGKARCTAGRQKLYDARRAQGVPAIQRRPKRKPVATPSLPRPQPKPTVLSEADIAFAKSVGMRLPKSD